MVRLTRRKLGGKRRVRWGGEGGVPSFPTIGDIRKRGAPGSFLNMSGIVGGRRRNRRTHRKKDRKSKKRTHRRRKH